MHIKNNAVKLFVHDCKQGIAARWKLFAVGGLFFLSAGLLLITSAARSAAMGAPVEQPTLLDLIIFALKGMAPYDPNSNTPFQVPVTWLFVHLFLAFLVGNYPVKDLAGYGQQMLLRSKKRTQWWLSKCAWCCGSVLLYYLAGYAVLFVLSLFAGGPGLTASPELSARFNEFLPEAPAGQLAAVALLLPILLSMALSLLQMLLSFATKPFFGYLFVAALLITSAFFFTPLLPGNHLMLLRSSAALPGGISGWVSLAYGLGLSAACIGGGTFYLKRYDILEKS